MKKLAILDLETTSLDDRTGDLWEIGLIMRDLREPVRTDVEYWWQVRPDLTHADPTALKTGRYYDRCRVQHKEIGGARRLSPDIQVPEGGNWVKSFTGGPPAEGDHYKNATAAGIARTLAPMLDGATIVANNPSFDRKFLDKFLRANGQLLTAHHRMIDIRALLIGYVDGRLSAFDGKVEDAFEPEAVPYVQDWLDGYMDSPAWEIVGITQEPGTRHTALGDARLDRDVYDAVRSGR
ncbi:hypothetical protein HII36_05780 [Nonomuraea sp. NN258]|uniref:hypothetical protein n=1 Tax=Nonomuraea antri TaxID=2730852 RepID=UPI0015683ABE|nr:hypothetical protein [Nonomuraea antri]NRQ31349.1 hypothetical protein [Nonomuraea antri]